MAGSTREMLQRRINELSIQLIDSTNKLRAELNLSRKLLDELGDAQKALTAVIAEETDRDSAEKIVTSILNRALSLESSGSALNLESTTAMVNEPEKRGVSRSGIKPGTIKAEVVKILRAHPHGLIALDILRLLNETRKIPLERTSLSPQLSRLAKAGHIQRRGSLWYIPEVTAP